MQYSANANQESLWNNLLLDLYSQTTHDNQLTNKQKNLVILGESGSGKRALYEVMVKKLKKPQMVISRGRRARTSSMVVPLTPVSGQSTFGVPRQNDSVDGPLKYSFFELDDSKVDVWWIENLKFLKLLELALMGMEKLEQEFIFLICLDVDEIDQMKNRLLNWLQGLEKFCENKFHKESKLREEQKVDLGFPTIVTVCKSDKIYQMVEKISDLISIPQNSRAMIQSILNFLQMHLRKICLDFGASLIYTSASIQSKNCDHLREYIISLIKHEEWNCEPEEERHTDILIPAGHDSNLLIEKLEVSFFQQDQPFEEAMQVPMKNRKLQEDDSVPLDDFHQFLKVQYQISSKQVPEELSEIENSHSTPLAEFKKEKSFVHISANVEKADIDTPTEDNRKLTNTAEKFFSGILSQFENEDS